MTWNTGVPAVGNQLTADIPDIQENLDCLGPYGVIWVPAEAMTPTVTNGAEAGSTEYATQDIMVNYFAFDGATEEFVSFNLVMPENWNRSTVKAKFYWTGAAGADVAETVEWEIGGNAIGNDEAIDAAIGTAQVISDTVLTAGSARVHISGATPSITIGGTPALGDFIHFKISRNVGGTDDMDDDAWMLGVAIQYTISNQISAW